MRKRFLQAFRGDKRIEMKMINDAHLARCCLLLCVAHSCVICSQPEPAFLQGFWHLCESVKNFFACGGQQGVRSQCAFAMLLPAGG